MLCRNWCGIWVLATINWTDRADELLHAKATAVCQEGQLITHWWLFTWLSWLLCTIYSQLCVVFKKKNRLNVACSGEALKSARKEKPSWWVGWEADTDTQVRLFLKYITLSPSYLTLMVTVLDSAWCESWNLTHKLKDSVSWSHRQASCRFVPSSLLKRRTSFCKQKPHWLHFLRLGS